MGEPIRASVTPYAVEVEAGQSYFWCACGRSKAQPFCDGSHKGTDFTPVKYEAIESRKVFPAVVKVQNLNQCVMVATKIYDEGSNGDARISRALCRVTESTAQCGRTLAPILLT